MGKKTSLGLIIMISVLFSASVGILHGRKKSRAGEIADESVTLSTQDTIDFLSTLLVTGSLDAAAQSMQQFSPEVIINAINALIEDQGPMLSDDKKVALIIGTAHYVPIVRDQLFSLLKQKYSRQPVFFNAAQNDFADAIPALLAWAKQDQKVLGDWIYSSLHEAIMNDVVDIVDSMYAQGIRVPTAQASHLLYDVVKNNKNVALVPFLVRYLAADPNYSPDGKRTVLIFATLNNNESMVRALLEAGAKPEVKLDPSIGSAAQVAHENGFVKIETLLSSIPITRS